MKKLIVLSVVILLCLAITTTNSSSAEKNTSEMTFVLQNETAGMEVVLSSNEEAIVVSATTLNWESAVANVVYANDTVRSESAVALWERQVSAAPGDIIVAVSNDSLRRRSACHESNMRVLKLPIVSGINGKRT